jgi:hypothetical protein
MSPPFAAEKSIAMPTRAEGAIEEDTFFQLAPSHSHVSCREGDEQLTLPPNTTDNPASE